MRREEITVSFKEGLVGIKQDFHQPAAFSAVFKVQSFPKSRGSLTFLCFFRPFPVFVEFGPRNFISSYSSETHVFASSYSCTTTMNTVPKVWLQFPFLNTNFPADCLCPPKKAQVFPRGNPTCIPCKPVVCFVSSIHSPMKCKARQNILGKLHVRTLQKWKNLG